MANIELHSFNEAVKEEESEALPPLTLCHLRTEIRARPLYYESTGFRFWKVSLPPINQYKGMDDGFSKVGKPVQ